MGVALHHEPIGEAEMVKQRDEPLDRRIGRGVAAAGLVRKFAGRSENVRVRVSCAGGRFDPRLPRMRHWAGNARRFAGDLVHLIPA
jgi:hypothetical protein